MPDKGKAGVDSFNAMQGSGDVGEACFEELREASKTRSDLLVYGKWTNPYTNKEELLDIWLPNECIDRNIRDYFKKAFDLDIGNDKKFIEFLEMLDKSLSDLTEFDDFMNICIEDYYKTPYYEQDKREAKDEYEMLNNLGDYSEDDEYVS